MKQADVKVGGIYKTYICGELAEVEVIAALSPAGTYGRKRTTYLVRRAGSDGMPLPKSRSAAALREVGS